MLDIPLPSSQLSLLPLVKKKCPIPVKKKKKKKELPNTPFVQKYIYIYNMICA